MELVFRIVLVVLATVAISFPLIDLPNIPNFYGTTLLSSSIFGNGGYLLPAAFACSAVFYFVRTVIPVQKIIDGIILAMTTLGGAYLVILMEGARRGRDMVPYIGGYAYIALIVFAAWGFIVSLRR